MSRDKDIKEIWNLLQQTSSLSVVSDFLKNKGLTHSASSWDDMLNKRLLPAVKDNHLSLNDLRGLLSSVEEYGRQHVFLYTIPREKSAELIEEKRVRNIAKRLGIANLLDQPRLLDQPKDPTISEIRWDSQLQNRLTIKIIEQRSSNQFVRDEFDGKYLSKIYETVNERAVNSVRLHKDGLLEFRVASHTNSSKYLKDIDRLWPYVEEFIPRDGIKELSLARAKSRLWDDKERLADIIKFTEHSLKNDSGTKLNATVHKDSNLNDDAGATAGLQAFMDYDAFCDSSNIWFLPQEGGVPSKSIHVLLSGESNEFAVTQACSKGDYEYVLKQLRHLNKKSS